MRSMLPLGLAVVALAATGALQASPFFPQDSGLELNSAASSPAQAAGRGPGLATGRGTTPLHRFEFRARGRHRASLAVQVLGRASFDALTPEAARYRISVTCLRVVGNRAALGGRTYESGRHRTGSRGVVFFVEDNGRGDGVDRISRLRLKRYPPKACPRPPALGQPSLPVRGDIVVEGAAS